MGELVERKQDWKHRCYPPGEFKSWLLRIGPGSIWKCDCGKEWRATENTFGFTALRWFDVQVVRDYERLTGAKR